MNDIYERLKSKGLVFDGVRGFLTKENKRILAQDAAITDPNVGIPDIMTAYLDPQVVEILLAPRNSRKILPEEQKGDWANTEAVFRTVESVGTVTAYTDYGNGAMSDTNVTYPVRQQFVGQTAIKYGDLEQARTAMAMIDLVSQKQISAATIIDAAVNKINLLGIEGMDIYGLLNDPNIPAALAPATVDGETEWSAKTTAAIYDDILSLYGQVIGASQGNVDQNADFVLAVPPAVSVQLGKATDYNVSVWDMVKRYAPNTEMVNIPELHSDTAGDSVMLVARKVNGMDTGVFGYGDKMRALRIVPFSSYYEQKFAFGTYGCILFYPFAVAKMTGV